MNQATQQITIVGNTNFTYFGGPVGPVATNVNKFGSPLALSLAYAGTNSTTYGPSTNRPTNAGTYFLLATLPGNDNWQTASSAPFLFTIDKMLPVIQVMGTNSFTYSGGPNGPTGANVDAPNITGLRFTYQGTNSTTYGPSTNRPTNAGTYFAVAGLEESANLLAASSAPFEFTITQASSTISVLGETSFTYNGSPQGPVGADISGPTNNPVTFNYQGTGGTSYGPSADKPVAAGSYTVTATLAGDGNFTEATSAPFAFTILALQNVTLAASSANLTFGESLNLEGGVNEILRKDQAVNQAIADLNPAGLSRTLTISGASALRPYQVELDLLIEGTGYGAALGDYYAYLRHTSADGVNQQTSVILNRLGVTPSDPTGSLADGINAIFSSATEANLAAAVDPSSGPLTGRYQASGLSALGEMDPNGTWTLFVADQSQGGTGRLAGWGLKLTEVPMIGSTGPSPVTYQVTEGANLVSLIGSQVTALSGTGTVKVRATAAATTAYAAGSAEITITLQKAPVSISSAPTASAITSGATLSSSTLTGGAAVSGASPVDGSFAWSTPSNAATASGSYPVTFTPAQTDNYEVATTNVVVTVNALTSLLANNINLTSATSSISVPMPTAALSAMTLEFWLKPASDLDSGTYSVVRKNSPSGGSELSVSLNYSSSTVASLSATVTAASDSSATASADLIDPLAWNHVALVVSSSSVQFFINGTAGSSTRLMRALAWSTQPLVFGRSFRGQIDDIRIYSGARDGSQISADKTGPALASYESSLVAYYKLDEGSGTALVDATGRNEAATGSNIAWGPGRSPGAWDITSGDYHLQDDGSSLLLELGGTEGTTLYDQIFVRNGAATLDGILSLMFIGSYTGPVSGSWNTFDLIWAQNGIVFGDNYQLIFNEAGYTVDLAVVDKDGGDLLQATVREVTQADLEQAAALARPALGVAKSPGPNGAVEMMYTYARPKGGVYVEGRYLVDGVKYEVQISNDLNKWDLAPVEEVSTAPAGDGMEDITVRVISQSHRGFLRLNVMGDKTPVQLIGGGN